MQGVYAGVRTTAANGFDGVAAESREGGFQGLLNGAVLPLRLPAVIGAAVIAEMQNNISSCHHLVPKLSEQKHTGEEKKSQNQNQNIQSFKMKLSEPGAAVSTVIATALHG